MKRLIAFVAAVACIAAVAQAEVPATPQCVGLRVEADSIAATGSRVTVDYFANFDAAVNPDSIIITLGKTEKHLPLLYGPAVSANTSTTIKNHTTEVVTQISWRYVFLAKKEGLYKFPNLSLETRDGWGATLTIPYRLRVSNDYVAPEKEAAVNAAINPANVKLSGRLSSDTIVLGDSVVMTVVLKSAYPVMGGDFADPFSVAECDVKPVTLPGEAVSSGETIDGVAFNVWDVTAFQLKPHHTGTYTITPAPLTLTVGATAWDSNKVKLKASAAPLTLTVLAPPVPEEPGEEADPAATAE